METLASETTITLLGAVFGAAWTFFKSQDWYQRAKQQRFAQAITALEAGVDQTYQTYVRAIKEASEDGKLTAAAPANSRAKRPLLSAAPKASTSSPKSATTTSTSGSTAS